MVHVLEETSNTKYELAFCGMDPSFVSRFVLYDMRLVNTSLLGVMNYSLLMPNLIAFYAELNEVLKIEFYFVLEVSFSILQYCLQ